MKFSHWLETYQGLLQEHYRFVRDEDEFALLTEVMPSEVWHLWNSNMCANDAFKLHIANKEAR